MTRVITENIKLLVHSLLGQREGNLEKPSHKHSKIFSAYSYDRKSIVAIDSTFGPEVECICGLSFETGPACQT